MGKQLSGAQKRKKKREKEELAAEMERLKLGPTPIWTGLVLHHKDVFCLACASEIERDGSVFLFICQFRESGCACVRRGKRIEIALQYSRIYIHFDVGIGVESHGLGREI